MTTHYGIILGRYAFKSWNDDDIRVVAGSINVWRSVKEFVIDFHIGRHYGANYVELLNDAKIFCDGITGTGIEL